MMKNPGRGTNGHICIQTNYLDRAIYHLEKRGFVFDESSFKYNDKGELTVAYLKDEIAGSLFTSTRNNLKKSGLHRSMICADLFLNINNKNRHGGFLWIRIVHIVWRAN